MDRGVGKREGKEGGRERRREGGKGDREIVREEGEEKEYKMGV